MMRDNMYDFELEPFCKISWKEKGLQELYPVFNEMKKSAHEAEIKTVADGLRDVATLTVDSNAMFSSLEMISDLGLVYIPIRRSRKVNGFAHKFYPPEEGKPIQIFGVIAREYDTANEFKEARLSGGEEHADIMGRLLGFPDCCIEYFQNTFYKEFDPVWTSALNTEGAKIEETENGIDVYLDDIYPSVNQLLRYVGLRVASNLPCSYKCEESKKFADGFIKHIRHKDLLLEVLSEMTWDCYKGIVIVDTPYFQIINDSMPFKKHHRIIIED